MACLKISTFRSAIPTHDLVDISDIFFFSAGGRGRGSARRREGGGAIFLLENPKEGGVSRVGEGGGARGREVVCREFGVGGAKYFFSGPKCPPR